MTSRLDQAPLTAVIENDAAMREALADLIEVFGYERRTFDSSENFLAAHVPGLFGCLITDLNLPGENGLQLQQRLKVLEPSLPVIIISAQTDCCSRERALRSGALAYLTKPINDQVLLRHLMSAFGRDTPSA
jgi:FixJ family two-component response regulator